MIQILDREAVVGTAMSAGEETFDDLPRDQLHVADTGETFGIEVAIGHFGFLICDFGLNSTPTLRRFLGGYHDSQYLVGFAEQWSNKPAFEQLPVDDELHPEAALVRFFDDDAQLRDEFSFRSGAACGPVVRPDRSARTDKLITDRPADHAAGIRILRAVDRFDGHERPGLLHLPVRRPHPLRQEDVAAAAGHRVGPACRRPAGRCRPPHAP